MGSMSASDAAPLPRLGEVYFDVRGESRSMRLSWYADTGVAVFSIWQGGTCTGTFRLPIADLPRMVQALQRGPDGDAGGAGEPPATGQARRGSPARDPQPAIPDREPGTGYAGSRRSSGYSGEPGSGYSGSRRASGRRAGAYPEDPAGVYHEGDPGGGRYAEKPVGEYSRDSRHGRYDEKPAGAYPGGGPGSGYEQEPAGPYPDDSLPGAYRDDSLPESGAAYLHEDLPYEPEPARPYPGDRPGGYEREHTAAYSGGGYEDEPTGVYHGDLLREGYEDERGGRYAAGGYAAEEYPGGPLAADYPTGPSAPDYPHAGDVRHYPASSRDPGYSPARPYVGPRTGEAGPPGEGLAHEPRRSRSRREDEPSPDSFPYGPPPSERPARGRAR